MRTRAGNTRSAQGKVDSKGASLPRSASTRPHLATFPAMKLLTSIRTGCSTARELIGSLMRGPYWWLVPVAALLLPAAVLFVFLQAVPWVAPFVYAPL